MTTMESTDGIRTKMITKSARSGIKLFACTYDASSIGSEPIVPHSRGTDEVRVISQRGERELRLLCRDKTAAASDHFADAIEKKRRALHDAAAQHDGVRSKQVYQVREAQSQIERLMFHCLQRDGIPLLRKFTDFLGGDAFAMGISRRRVGFEPRHHRGAGGQRFPAAAKSARALRTHRIDYVMSDFGMGVIDA